MLGLTIDWLSRPCAKAVKQQAQILSGAVGLITTATQAEAILQKIPATVATGIS